MTDGGSATTDLREKQGPLKQRYREDPTAALVTLTADGELDGTGVACRVRTATALAEAGLHPATGGDGTQLCSGDMLLEALVACAGVTLRAVATSMGLDVAGTVHAEGDLDFRGTRPLSNSAVRVNPQACTSSAPNEDTPTSVTHTGSATSAWMSATLAGHSSIFHKFQSSGKPCTATAST